MSTPARPHIHIVEHVQAQPLDAGGDERGRADEAHGAAHGGEQVDVGAGNAAMGDVAADGDRQPIEPAAAAADGEGVEQRLGGMFVGAVAGVYHRGVHFLRKQGGRAGLVVADHEQVALHGVERAGGIEQGLALVHRAGGYRHVDDVGAEAFAGELETGAGAGAVLEEEINEGLAAQHVALGFAGAIEECVAFRQIQELADFGRVHAFDRQQVGLGLHALGHR